MRRIALLGLLALAVAGFGASAAASATRTYLLGWPCQSEYDAAGRAMCAQHAMFKPGVFQLGPHYSFRKVVWESWNPYTATAKLTLWAQFAGMAKPSVHHGVTVIFSKPERLCGVLTYTNWVSSDGNAGQAEKSPGVGCFFGVG